MHFTATATAAAAATAAVSLMLEVIYYRDSIHKQHL